MFVSDVLSQFHCCSIFCVCLFSIVPFFCEWLKMPGKRTETEIPSTWAEESLFQQSEECPVTFVRSLPRKESWWWKSQEARTHLLKGHYRADALPRRRNPHLPPDLCDQSCPDSHCQSVPSADSPLSSDLQPCRSGISLVMDRGGIWLPNGCQSLHSYSTWKENDRQTFKIFFWLFRRQLCFRTGALIGKKKFCLVEANTCSPAKRLTTTFVQFRDSGNRNSSFAEIWAIITVTQCVPPAGKGYCLTCSSWLLLRWIWKCAK